MFFLPQVEMAMWNLRLLPTVPMASYGASTPFESINTFSASFATLHRIP
ncbi:unnamed protein product [Penicillium camemberti]|uniref:Str. FM013 n=1 Tax=Penicillium camemberti (strain FM 013) TaxID=1429867 RepID=A0A0G4PW07_PENC3|nr:unnamed protein product [Penicillium camemberti]